MHLPLRLHPRAKPAEPKGLPRVQYTKKRVNDTLSFVDEVLQTSKRRVGGGDATGAEDVEVAGAAGRCRILPALYVRNGAADSNLFHTGDGDTTRANDRGSPPEAGARSRSNDASKKTISPPPDSRNSEARAGAAGGGPFVPHRGRVWRPSVRPR